ncbi:FAD-dependent monooxygenase [Streptomyces sp. NPDC040724]|uniref:aromatic-ring hydroxylase C-terminal domain-containing protein n=1 Tax=unclassified Streptomyces TaxID=2593676 RepID=UPI0033C2C833
MVAGGGPVGLMPACELRLDGARVVVVERRTNVDRTIKAGAIYTPTAEAVRPDGCTAWAADAADGRADAAQGLAASLAQWFGAQDIRQGGARPCRTRSRTAYYRPL